MTKETSLEVITGTIMFLGIITIALLISVFIRSGIANTVFAYIF